MLPLILYLNTASMHTPYLSILVQRHIFRHVKSTPKSATKSAKLRQTFLKWSKWAKKLFFMPLHIRLWLRKPMPGQMITRTSVSESNQSIPTKIPSKYWKSSSEIWLLKVSAILQRLRVSNCRIFQQSDECRDASSAFKVRERSPPPPKKENGENYDICLSGESDGKFL